MGSWELIPRRATGLTENVQALSARQFIAIGGSGFSVELANLLLDQYILKLANQEKPRVCFVFTASGKAKDHIDPLYTICNQNSGNRK